MNKNNNSNINNSGLWRNPGSLNCEAKIITNNHNKFNNLESLNNDINNINYKHNSNNNVNHESNKLLNLSLSEILISNKLAKDTLRPKNSINIVFLGDKCTGKTCLAIQYTASKFDHYYIQTIAREEYSKSIKSGGKDYSLNLVVTSGVPQYQEDYTQFYSEADFFIICFDLTQPESFEKAKKIIHDEIKTYATLMKENFANMVLLGNKADLSLERKVSNANVSEFCVKYKIQFYEVSAKTKHNVQTVFKKIVEVFEEIIYCN